MAEMNCLGPKQTPLMNMKAFYTWPSSWSQPNLGLFCCFFSYPLNIALSEALLGSVQNVWVL